MISTIGLPPVTMTRQELHNRVWMTPMSHLAGQLGISGNGLAKICVRLGVPYPPRGHWAKVAAGKAAKMVALPQAKPGTPLSVEIRPTQSPGVKRGEQVLEGLPAEVRKVVTSARVSSRLVQPHPLVAGWLASHEKRLAEARREREPWARKMLAPGEFTADDRRRHRIADAILKALERCGAMVGETDRGMLVAEVSGSKVEFDLREKLKQVRRPLTEEESRWETWNKSGFKQELAPTGCMVLSIKNYLDGSLRREWLETSNRPMETSLPEIVATILQAGEVLKERRKKAEHEAALYEERRRLREEERARQKEGDDRWARFVEAAGRWDEVTRMRSFLAVLKSLPVENGESVDGRSLAKWMEWAEQRVATLDPLRSGIAGLFEEIFRKP